MKICICNNCNTIYEDSNPSEQSIEYPNNLMVVEKLPLIGNIEEMKYGGYYGCSKCNTDGYLKDNIPNFNSHMKDSKAFDNKIGICYIPESEDSAYTYAEFLEIAKGNILLAAMIFQICTWQHPETVFEEGIIEGEWSENGTIIPQD